MHPHPLLWDSRANSLLHDCFDADLHKSTRCSARDAVLGTLAPARAGVAHIGWGLAQTRGLRPKHAVKQVDRLLSNQLLDLEALAPSWLAFVVGNCTDIVIAFDWTDFAKDDQSTLALSVIARDGRATPVLWKTVQRSGILHNAVEDELRERLRAAIHPPIRITLLANRGFASQMCHP